MSKKETTKVRTEWDTEYSTYFWHIHTDPDHPQTATPLLTGYSKKRFQSEAQDKNYLLQRKICMLYQNSYFSKMKKIEFFARTGDIMDKATATKILICYPYEYEIMELNFDVIYKRHGTWLTQFYNCIRAGRSIDEIIPGIKKGVDKDYFINPNNYISKIKDIYALYAHGKKLEKFGWPDGVIKHFITTFKQMKGW